MWAWSCQPLLCDLLAFMKVLPKVQDHVDEILADGVVEHTPSRVFLSRPFSILKCNSQRYHLVVEPKFSQQAHARQKVPHGDHDPSLVPSVVQCLACSAGPQEPLLACAHTLMLQKVPGLPGRDRDTSVHCSSFPSAFPSAEDLHEDHEGRSSAAGTSRDGCSPCTRMTDE